MSNVRMYLPPSGMPDGAAAVWVPRKINYRDGNRPCRPGDTVYWLEWWLWNYWHHIYEYRADFAEDSYAYKYVKWHVPQHMPSVASRHVWTIDKVEAVQVKNINYQQAKACGFEGYIALLASEIITAEEELQIYLDTNYPDLSMNIWGWLINKGD